MSPVATKSRFSHTPEEAMLERIQREKARRHLIDYSLYMADWYQAWEHHVLVAEKLEQVARYIETGGKEGIGRLMIFEPPRYGKTTQVSQLFPSWLLGRMPDINVILSSYGADLAIIDSVAVRDYLSHQKFSALFGEKSGIDKPVRVREDSRSRDNWKISRPHRGGVLATGVGGRIVGFGAHLLNINDPFKGRKEAQSEAYRKDVMTWYQGNAYTRLEQGGAVIITHTRWDQEDLAGQMLMRMVSDDQKADQWEVVFLPEIALDEKQYPKTEEDYRENLLRGTYVPLGGDQLGRKPGEILCEGKFTKKEVEDKRANMGDFEYIAQCQQMPRLAVGNFFDDDDFTIVDKAPANLQWFRFIDLALGKSKTSDFNATLAVALDGNGDLYVRDMLKIRNLEEFFPACKALMLEESEHGTIWAVEDVAFQNLVLRDFLAAPELAMIPIMGIYPEGDKVSRAQAWRLKAKQGKVYLIRAPWNLSFIRTAAAFGPNARHDDEIDSVSGGVQLIAEFPSIEREGEVVVYEERVSISAY